MRSPRGKTYFVHQVTTLFAAMAGIVCLLATVPVSAWAAPTPSWKVEAIAPTDFVPGNSSTYTILATNMGSGSAEEVKLTDEIPVGLELKSISFYWSGLPGFDLNPFLEICPPPSGRQISCDFAASTLGAQVEPGESVKVVIDVGVPLSASEAPVGSEAVVEGGGASASVSFQGAIRAKPALEIDKFTMYATESTLEEPREGPDSASHYYEFVNKPYQRSFTQAGGRPWALTTAFEFATEANSKGILVPTRNAKDIVAGLPPGLLGNPMSVPRCSLTLVTNEGKCPGDTQIGVARLNYFGGKAGLAPIVNVTPEAGQSAEFALENTVKKVVTPLLTAHLVRSGEGYSFDVASNEVPIVALRSAELTFWGAPADPSHDVMRGRFCTKQVEEEPFECSGGGEQVKKSSVPFLSMPTTCSAGPESATLRADSWQEPGSVGVNGKYSGYVERTTSIPAVTGCNVLQFNAGTGVSVEPDTLVADEPVGLGVNLKVPLNEVPTTNATPQLRDTLVTLPEGMSVSPGVVDGIEACNATGPEGINIVGPESEDVGLNGELQLAPGRCPNASIVGTAEAITPFLPVPVRGHVYLARPGCGGAGQGPCSEQDARDGNLYKLYLELGGTGEFANTGIEFKVPLETEANPATGQLTSVAHELVQAPYSEVKIRLSGGPRAPIANPAVCGPATTTADFTPWSAPGRTLEGSLVAGTADAISSSFFDVGGCFQQVPFNPSFVAGTVTPNAGQFTAFTMNLARQDREQYVKGIQVHTPAGLLGMLSSVPLCGEPAGDAGDCSESSKIGTTRVASGAGSHPFEIEGKVYLTGPYEGAPFGLSIVVPVVAGPFNLGLKVVRAKIAVDPETSELTVTTDEGGPYAIPQIVFGVPVRLKRVTVNIDRPGFMFNPTSCAAKSINSKISGSQNSVASVSSQFAAGGCKSLAFKPKFTVSTRGHTSRARGASLDVKLSYPGGSVGQEANIAKVKVSLPKQLPSELKTLQKACTAAIFAANPADCPRASIVGVAKAHTPLLPVGLSGPVYFVSHGGEAFPSLIVVLEGDGVRVDLTGTTFINKAGITSSTFKTVPDVPVQSFELYLPQGKFSALAANGNLCRSESKLKMPTEFVAQNGAVIRQKTQIDVTGCERSAKRSTASGKSGNYNRRKGR